jgi:hypothetical protein
MPFAQPGAMLGDTEVAEGFFLPGVDSEERFSTNNAEVESNEAPPQTDETCYHGSRP